MNRDQIKGNWNQMRGTLKDVWGDLPDDDLTRIEGDRDRLTGTLQERYGIARDKAEKQLKDTFNG